MTRVGKVAWRDLPHAGFVMARANSPIKREWGGDLLSLPYAVMLTVFVVLYRDQARTATRPGKPGRAVLLLTPPGGSRLGAGAVVFFAGLAVATCVGTLAARVLLPTALVAGGLGLFVVLALLELAPAGALAWRTRALAQADREAREAHPDAALLHWVAAYPRGHHLGSDLLTATVAQEGAQRSLRLSTRTRRLTRWYAHQRFETIAIVDLPGASPGEVEIGAAMVRRPAGARARSSDECAGRDGSRDSAHDDVRPTKKQAPPDHSPTSTEDNGTMDGKSDPPSTPTVTERAHDPKEAPVSAIDDGPPSKALENEREIPTSESTTDQPAGSGEPPAIQNHVPEAKPNKFGSVDMDAISAKVARLHALVPEIGSRWRWYDIPYKLFHWVLTGWRRKLVPKRLRQALNRGMNFLLAFNHYDRQKVQLRTDPRENLIVPPGEEVLQGGFWVVEFFPPSHYSSLQESLRKNGWDSERPFLRHDGTNAEQVAQARHGSGFLWSRLGAVTDTKSKFPTFDAKREALPEEFDYIELTAMQIGRSLTAVTAFVRLSETGQRSLDTKLKEQREPTLRWQGLKRPDVQGRLFSAYHSTQEERKRLHDLARAWLTARCGGFFAGTPMGQPLVDFSLFAKWDPLGDTSDSLAMRDSLRALGFNETVAYHYVSPQLPGAVLIPPPTLDSRRTGLRNCWGVVGSLPRVSALSDKRGYGTGPPSVPTLAATHDDAIRAFGLYVAVQSYMDEVRRTHAISIDEAKSRHGRYSARRLESLRFEMLSSSLDLSVVARDVAELWTDQWRHLAGIKVTAEPAPGMQPLHPDGFDLIGEWEQRRAQVFGDLIEEDRVYREVLSTASSLGASAESSRLGRRALVASFASLGVAIVAVLVANTGGDTLLSQVVEWIRE